jgi:hypothetical protein
MAKKVKKAKKANTKKAKKSASKSKPKKAVAKGRLARPAAAGGFTLKAKDVPENKVEVTTKGFINAGATKVEKEKQATGKYTLTAAFAR